MNHFSTRHGVLVFLVWVVTMAPAGAQPAGFIHLQSENSLAYQVTWNGNTYSSNAGGYLVIPQVMAGEHTLIIGFAPEIALPYAFKVTLADNPRGFSIRQNIDNSWSLFDMIDFSLLKGNPFIAPKSQVLTMPEENNVTSPKEEKKSTTAAAIKKDSAIAVKPANTTINKLAKQTLSIQKIFDKTGNEGIDQVYTISRGSRIDTIALFIPVIDIRQEPPGQWAYYYQSANLFTESDAKMNKPVWVNGQLPLINHRITRAALVK